MKLNKKAVVMKQTDNIQTQPITVKGLRIISRRILPLYERIANDRLYAKRLINAMRTFDLDRTTRVIQQELPGAGASIGAGFSASYSLRVTKKTKVYLDTGIFSPGQLLSIQSEDIRRVSLIMLQLLRKLANDGIFAARFIRLVRTRKQAELLRLVNNVNSKLIVSATISEYGPLFVVCLSNGKRYNLSFEQS
ncbi:hypothetical protein LJR153_003646 [Paenibacillus sp. LjRoot153]|uniref:hypothetical protein n=1 Tax=Paenibacillus sp. LjRoot153 TaxID=3342270 RepID=UPI003ECCA174